MTLRQSMVVPRYLPVNTIVTRSIRPFEYRGLLLELGLKSASVRAFPIRGLSRRGRHPDLTGGALKRLVQGSQYPSEHFRGMQGVGFRTIPAPRGLLVNGRKN